MSRRNKLQLRPDWGAELELNVLQANCNAFESELDYVVTRHNLGTPSEPASRDPVVAELPIKELAFEINQMRAYPGSDESEPIPLGGDATITAGDLEWETAPDDVL